MRQRPGGIDDGALKRGSVGQAQFDSSASIGSGAQPVGERRAVRRREDPMAKKRNRARHTAFEERLAEQAEKFKEAASKLPNGGKAREHLLQRARQLETAAHINKWLSSPEQQPTKIPELLADLKR
jgi:hypothetical protein